MLIFGCGSFNSFFCFSKGIAVYDKDLNMINTFESIESVNFIMSIDN
jgi:hypothetical protein